MIKVTERGWPGHFCAADRCLFRRNTLIEGPNDSVIVSTAGSFTGGEIGVGRDYETMVFGVQLEDSHPETNFDDQRFFEGKWAVKVQEGNYTAADYEANEMHDNIVAMFKGLV